MERGRLADGSIDEVRSSGIGIVECHDVDLDESLSRTERWVKFKLRDADPDSDAPLSADRSEGEWIWAVGERIGFIAAEPGEKWSVD